MTPEPDPSLESDFDAIDWSTAPRTTVSAHFTFEVPVELIDEIRARAEEESAETGDVEPD
jgi:hypothetical protein